MLSITALPQLMLPWEGSLADWGVGPELVQSHSCISERTELVGNGDLVNLLVVVYKVAGLKVGGNVPNFLLKTIRVVALNRALHDSEQVAHTVLVPQSGLAVVEGGL